MKKLYLIITLLLLILALPSYSFSQQYEIVDLGSGSAYDINNYGWTVGESNGMPCLWNSNGEKTYLSSSSGTAYGINDFNQVVGVNNGQAFLWKNGQLTALPGADVAFDINNSGTVIGGIEYYLVYSRDYSVVYGENGQWQQPIGSANYSRSWRTFVDINDLGIIAAGWSAWGGGSGATGGAFTYDTNTGTRTDTNLTYFLGINNLNQIVGFAGYDVPTKWENNNITYLNAPGVAIDLNDNGWIIGQDRHEGGWLLIEPNAVVFLEQLLSPELAQQWDLETVKNINNLGQMVGYGTFNGELHAYLLNPIPEPMSFLLFGTGLIGLACLAKKSV